jgi:indolepyruvate ferredoxin oxidoreductase beta subunit
VTETVNVLIVGVGGQGVLKASQVLADALVACGHDVKQSEVHGMSQRGGSVVSEVRFGPRVHSPLAPWGAADYVVALNADEGRRAEPRLRPGQGRLIDLPSGLQDALANPRSRNMAALGRLARHLDVPYELWHDAIRRALPPSTHEDNIAAFRAGRRFVS